MDECRLIKLGRLAATGLISRKPCLVYSIAGVGVDSTDNSLVVYDGWDTSGRIIMTLIGSTYTSDFRVFSCPLYFAKGIYAVFATNASELFVQYMEVGP